VIVCMIRDSRRKRGAGDLFLMFGPKGGVNWVPLHLGKRMSEGYAVWMLREHPKVSELKFAVLHRVIAPGLLKEGSHDL
jgi:hypothetical protein